MEIAFVNVPGGDDKWVVLDDEGREMASFASQEEAQEYTYL